MVDELGLVEHIDNVVKQDHTQRQVSVGLVRQGYDLKWPRRCQSGAVLDAAFFQGQAG